MVMNAELDRLRAEVASLIKENENLKAYAKHERSLGAEPWMLQCNDLTQQLAAANGRVERMRGFGDSQPEFEAYAYQQGHLDFEQNEFGGYKNPHTSILWWFWKSSRDELRIRLSSSLSDLPYEVPSFDEHSSEADKEKS